MSPLEKQFNQDMMQIYKRAKNELCYNATRLLQILTEKGGLQAAKQLIAKDGGTYGFEVLWENHRLDLTVEAHVIREEYKPLFSDEEIEMCKGRLKEFGYKI